MLSHALASVSLRKGALALGAALLLAQFGAGMAGSVRGVFRSSKPQTPANLIAKPTSDESTAGWYGWHSTLVRDPSVSKFGPPALAVRDIGSASFSVSYTTPISGVTAGLRYSLSVWIYVRPGSRLVGKQMAIEFGELGGHSANRYELQARATLHFGWQYLTGIGNVVEPDRTSLDFEPVVLDGAVGGDTFYVDDADVEQITSRASSPAVR